MGSNMDIKTMLISWSLLVQTIDPRQDRRRLRLTPLPAPEGLHRFEADSVTRPGGTCGARPFDPCVCSDDYFSPVLPTINHH
jgi:hypothetical protein